MAATLLATSGPGLVVRESRDAGHDELLEREGMTVVAFPQHDARMIPASARLHAAIVEKRLTLPDDEEFARHASEAIARHNRRGWRIDKPNPRSNTDAVIALAMAVERADDKPASVELLGWL